MELYVVLRRCSVSINTQEDLVKRLLHKVELSDIFMDQTATAADYKETIQSALEIIIKERMNLALKNNVSITYGQARRDIFDFCSFGLLIKKIEEYLNKNPNTDAATIGTAVKRIILAFK